MKEALVGLLLCVGLIGFNACGDKKNNVSIIDTNQNYINLRARYFDLSSGEHSLDSINNTYSLTGNYSFIGFGVGIIKNGEPVTPNVGDVIWSYDGPNVGVISGVNESQANLSVNGTTGTIIVKAQYEIIIASMTIHIIP